MACRNHWKVLRSSLIRLKPTTITATYLLVGVLWVPFADYLLIVWLSDETMLAQIQAFKGWFFVCVTAAILLLLMRRSISTLRRSKQALRVEHTKLRTLIESTTDEVLIKDLEGRYVLINAAVSRTLGKSTQEIIGRDDRALYSPDSARMMMAEDRQVMTTGEPHTFESRATVDRMTRIYSTVKAPYRDPSGRIIGIICIARDITKRKQAEEALRQAHEELEIRVAERTAELARSNAALRKEIVEHERTERELRKEHALLNAIIEGTTDAIFVLDAEGCYALLNTAEAQLLDKSIEELIGKHLTEVFPPPTARLFLEGNRQVMASGQAQTFEHTMTVTGTQRIYSMVKAPYWDANGQIAGVIGIARDITERKQAEERLRLWKHVVESTKNGVTIADATREDYPIIAVNPAFEWITGYAADEVLGRNPRFLHEQDHEQPGLKAVRTALRKQRSCNVVLRNYRKDGSLFWNKLYIAPVRNNAGQVTHFVGMQDDITEYKAYEARLHHQANYDALTGLPNRTLLKDRIHHALIRAQRTQRLVAVLFLDLDRFKMINDSLGHALGDALLQAVAKRLTGCVRKADTVARLGGDEFVIVLEALVQEKHAAAVARKVLKAMDAPFILEGQECVVTPSIGISLYPRDGADEQSLLKHADMALYRAKDQGGNSIQYYTAEMNDQALERLTLENDLRYALARDELRLYYQPKVSLESGQVIGAEALLRWQHPQRGMVLPTQFIPLAEETGLIAPLGEWVIKTACAQAKAWRKAGLETVSIAVNLSARQFLHQDVPDMVARVLQDGGFPAQQLELEITESVLMKDVEGAITTLDALKALGVTLSVDDFGTGYSSLSYLKRFSLDRLKIDRSFVHDITDDPDSAAIATAVITLAHSLKLKVIAEGVENPAQLVFLRARHCDEIQGYYFSPPLPAEEMTALLREKRTLPLEGIRTPGKGTLLLVDDEKNSTESISQLLRRQGYQVLAASSGWEGLALLAHHRVEVVISDQFMPGMSGTIFLKRVRDLYPHIMRILISGRDDREVLIDAINDGYVHKFVAKPVNPVYLQAIIHEAFLFHRQQVNQVIEHARRDRAQDGDASEDRTGQLNGGG